MTLRMKRQGDKRGKRNGIDEVRGPGYCLGPEAKEKTYQLILIRSLFTSGKQDSLGTVGPRNH